MSDFTKIAVVGDIPIGALKSFQIGHDRIVIIHTGEGLFALRDECSHDSAPISDGRIRGNDIMCARHGARFDIKSGAVTAPPALVPIDTIELRIDNEEIFVRIED